MLKKIRKLFFNPKQEEETITIVKKKALKPLRKKRKVKKE